MLLQNKNDFAYREGSQAAFLVFKHFPSLYQHDTNLCLNPAYPHHTHTHRHTGTHARDFMEEQLHSVCFHWFIP